MKSFLSAKTFGKFLYVLLATLTLSSFFSVRVPAQGQTTTTDTQLSAETDSATKTVTLVSPAAIPIIPVPFFSQRDYSPGRWGAKTLGSPTDPKDTHGCDGITIGRHGCFITSLAMLYNYYELEFTDPSRLNNDFVRRQLFGPNDDGRCLDIIKWPSKGSQDFGGPLGVTYEGTTGDLDSELSQGYPVFAAVVWGPKKKLHAVLIVGKQADGQYVINDPWVDPNNLSPSF